jgi:hypothetical protein
MFTVDVDDDEITHSQTCSESHERVVTSESHPPVSSSHTHVRVSGYWFIFSQNMPFTRHNFFDDAVSLKPKLIHNSSCILLTVLFTSSYESIVLTLVMWLDVDYWLAECWLLPSIRYTEMSCRYWSESTCVVSMLNDSPDEVTVKVQSSQLVFYELMQIYFFWH